MVQTVSEAETHEQRFHEHLGVAAVGEPQLQAGVADRAVAGEQSVGLVDDPEVS
jgi:hypothetical protein